MYVSKLAFRTQKENPSDEFSRGAQLLVRAGFVEKNFSGVYTYLPSGLKVLRNVEALIRKEMDAIGGQEMLMPSLTPKTVWDTSGRWEVLGDILYKLKDGQDKTLSLAPTHEDVLSAIMVHHLSGNDRLPLYVYQIQNKFRDEPRAKSGLIRTREFLMKDLYSFHTSFDDLNRFYEIVKEAYVRIFKACGVKAYVTQASGGAFSKENSHEFMVESSAGEDRVFVCPECDFSKNVEVVEDESKKECNMCRKGIMREIKAIEVGNIFKLGTKFSDAFGLYTTSKEGNKMPVVMGSYGIGLGRIMGTIAEVSSDDRGLIWPTILAPYQIYLVPLEKSGGDTGDVTETAQRVYKGLQASGFDILYDDREKSAGEKFGDADILGIPLRLVISEKTLKEDSVEVKERRTGKITMAPLSEVVNIVRRFLI